MNRSFLVVCLLIFFLGGCQDDDRWEAQLYGPLVVDGWIDSDGHPTVQFTNSLIPNDKEGNISDVLIKWGKITMTDGIDTVILTGTYDNKLLPPYRYYTTRLTGIPGRTYTIWAEYDGKSVRSQCTMPPAPRIDSVKFSKIEDNDSICSATLFMKAPADCPAYYHISATIGNYPKTLVPATLGSFRIDTPGKNVSVPVMKGKRLNDTIDFTPHWPYDTSVIIRLERVTEKVYDFWKAFDDANMFGGSQFIQSTHSLPSNIEGGFGCFSAQGADTKLFNTLKRE